MTRVAAVEWFRGPLLSRHFAERVLPQAFADRLGEASADAAHRRLRRWLVTANARLGPASGVRTIAEVGAAPFFACLGYRLRAISTTGDPDVLIATLDGARAATIRVVIAPWQTRLDQSFRATLRAGIEAHQRWAFCFNARVLRLVDVDRPFARRFIEFDLAETIADHERCRVLSAITRPAALVSSTGDESLLAEIVEACDAHGVGVREALQGGVRSALDVLCAELARTAAPPDRVPRVSPGDVVSQALTLLYRLLFLLFAEARSLVPVWHPIYRDSYTIGTLQRHAERASPRGLWDALQAISRLAHAGCVTGEFTMTAFNSQLFAPAHAPLVDRARIESAAIAHVLQALMTAPGRRGRERITYADLGVEQLGAVYERILDYAPELERAVAARGSSSLSSPHTPLPAERNTRVARTSVRRKESGTFYTPRSLADYLVRETLGPLTASVSADRILTLRILDPAMGSGAFLVSACRFLARAYEQALDREGRPLPTSEAARANVRRTIARQCLFGVDLNPMAVQLARLSLWLTTLTTDAPLTFLDHHLCVGNSLIGATLDDLAHRRSRARRRETDTLPLFSEDDTSQAIRAILPSRERLAIADDSPETVHAKEHLLASLARESALAAWLRLADIWCASWFWQDESRAKHGVAARMTASPDAPPHQPPQFTPPRSTPPPPPPTAWPEICDEVLRGRSTLPRRLAADWIAHAQTIAARRRFFHWTLEFPEVFFDASGQPRPEGGFDAIVGNPPWDMVRDDVRDDVRDETHGDARSSTAAFVRFVREAGIYEATREAHANSYQLFVDRALSLLRRGGRIGLVVPWGLAADHGSARLRRRLLERCEVETMVSFDNRDGVFPIHRSVRFVLFTATKGRPTTAVRCRFGERDPTVLDRLDASSVELASARAGPDDLSMSPALLRRLSGEGLAFPDVRSRAGLALVERLHATWPSLTSRDGWNVTFSRELNVTDDRARFVRAPAAGWPVIEGKHVHPFEVRAHEARFIVPPEHMDVVRARVPGVARHRLAYRDVSSPANRLTLIAAILPPFVVSTHTLFCLRSPLDLDAQACLCALMNSIVANYLVRLRVSTHVTVALLDHLPMPKPLRGSEAFRALGTLATNPTATGRAHLQAWAARAYGLTPDELAHVLGTFPLIDEGEKQAVFEAFVSMSG